MNQPNGVQWRGGHRLLLSMPPESRILARRTSVSGSPTSPGDGRNQTVLSVIAYRSFLETTTARDTYGRLPPFSVTTPVGQSSRHKATNQRHSTLRIRARRYVETRPRFAVTERSRQPVSQIPNRER